MARGKPLIQIDGLRQLRVALKAAEHAAGDLKEAHLEAAEIVADEAAGLAPRRTGALAGSVRAAGQVGGAVVRAGRGSLPYAGPIHFGWRAHNIEPQPFVYDALDKRRDEVIDAYREAVDEIADSI